jgi:hypothetical protein
VIYPEDEDLDWPISVHTRPRPFGGYEIEHRDAATGEQATTVRADHATIAAHVLGWISHP